MNDLTDLEISQAAEIKKLKRENLELQAGMAFSYHTADMEIHKTNTKTRMGSGVLLQLSAIGGKDIINPVMIRDGLSDETIECLKKDIARSYELTTMFKPKGI